MDVGRQGVHQEQQIDSRGSFLAQRALIIELAAQYRLPMCYAFRDYAELGGLMAYAPDLGELAKRMANDVHEIFNGAKPGEIPFYQPTKFELIINLKTANRPGGLFYQTRPRSLVRARIIGCWLPQRMRIQPTKPPS